MPIKEHNYKISFRGDSKTLFKIWIINLLLTVCTLGIYYPWARANMKKYLYSSTYLDDYSFDFHGTGKQMFIGLVKFLVIFLLAFSVLKIIATFIPENIEQDIFLRRLFNLAILIPYMPILALFIHGVRKYRMSRTSYRGIRFGYRGKKKLLVLLFLENSLITLATFGIYYPWFANNVRKYVYSKARFGNIKLSFSGNSSDYADIIILGWVLTFFTLGIYYFWFRKELFKFFYENISFGKNEDVVNIKTNVTGGKYFKLISGNWLILLFTLGLGYPITKIRSMHFIADNLELYGNIDLNDITQAEENYANATGDAYNADDSGNFFDLDIF